MSLNESIQQRSNPLIIILTIIGFFALTFAIFGSSINNNFVAWDDTALIYNNPAVKGFSAEHLKKAFTTFDPELYIPLTFVSWQMDYTICGLNPAIFHLGNVILHTLNALLVLAIVKRLTGKAWLGWLCGLLFAVHPLNVEAVAWASARKDVLSSFFFLGSITTYLRYRSRSNLMIYGVSIFLFLLALLSKVSVIMLPLSLLLIDWFQKRTIDRSLIIDKLPYFILSIVFGIVALFGKQEVLESTGLMAKILMAAKSTVFYLQKLIIPTDLTVMYPYNDPVLMTSMDFAVPALLICGLIALIIYLSFRWRPGAFGLAFFMVNLIPSFTNFAKGGEVYVASDRYAYIPSIGIFLIVGLALQWLITRAADKRSLDRNIGIGAIAALGVIVTFGFAAHAQTAIWQDSETLFSDVSQKQPSAIAAHVNLGILARESGQLDKALEHIRAAAAIRKRIEVYTNFANIYKLQGRIDLATKEFEQAMVAFPTKPEPHVGLGIIYQEQGKNDAAIAEYKRAIELEPDYTVAYNNLGSLYEHLNHLPEAQAELKKALTVNPYFTEGHYSLGIIYERQKKISEAASSYQQALALNPMHTEAALRLSALYLQAGRNGEALALLKNILGYDPENEQAKAIIQEMVRLGIVGQK